MPEYAVHDDMQIVPHRDLPCGFVAFQHMDRIVKKMLSICQKRRAFNGGQRKPAQSGIQKPQIYQQRIPGKQQDLPGKRVLFFLFSHMFAGSLNRSIPCNGLWNDTLLL